VQYDNAIYQLDHAGPGYTMRGAKVTVCQLINGKIVVLYKDRELPYTCLRRGEIIPPPVDAKMLNQRVDQASEKQARSSTNKPAQNHPWRKTASVPQKAITPVTTS
jgi:hypothetical protein